MSKSQSQSHDDFEDHQPTRLADSTGGSSQPTAGGASFSTSDWIGPYKLLQRIGEGGMGEVWMAEQQKPVRRRVALKLIRGDVGTKETIGRFEAERQALAMMDHQNIAKVFDAGTTPNGNPYFVMELVKGIPLTEYCDSHKLGIKQRLELLVPVCKAIQHAHLKGIIHRDLKPSNVLVTLYDGKPVPKVIDFGLAKALDHQQKLTDKTMFTEYGKVVGTLQYMSPEQAEMNALDVDTRTDIYSIGVMLYELLTGVTPIDKDTLHQNALFRVLEIIREEEPQRPSYRLSTTGDATSGEISLQRKLQPQKLQQILQGELDWIVMKALEKDRTRRYETPNDLAADIVRYLNNETVLARPASTAYKFQKFIKKNRGWVAAAASIVGLLIVGSVGTGWFAFKAEAARKKAVAENVRANQLAEEAEHAAENALAAEKLAQLSEAKAIEAKNEAMLSAKRSEDVLKVVTDSFDSANPNTGANADVSARDVLLNAKDILEKSELDEVGKAKLLGKLTQLFVNLGDYKVAIATAEKHLEIRRAINEPNDPQIFQIRNWLGNATAKAGDLDGAISIYEALINDIRESKDPSNKILFLAMNNLGIAYGQAERYTDAIDILRTVTAAREATLGPDHTDTALSMGTLGMTLSKAGRSSEAIEILEQTHVKMKADLGEDHPTTLAALSSFGSGYHRAGEWAKAGEIYERLLSMQKKKLGEDHPKALGTMNNLALIYAALGELEKALTLYDETLEVQKARIGLEHRETQITVSNMALAVHRLVFEFKDRMVTVDFEDAASLLDRLREYESEFPDVVPPRWILQNLQTAQLASGHSEEAEKTIGQWIDGVEDALKKEKSDKKTSDLKTELAWAMTSDAASLLGQSKFVYAEKRVREALAISECEEVNRVRCESIRAVCLAEQGSFELAEPMALASFERLEKMRDSLTEHNLWCLPECASRVRRVYELWDLSQADGQEDVGVGFSRQDKIAKWKKKTDVLTVLLNESTKSAITAAKASEINLTIWNKVAKPNPKGSLPISDGELAQMREVCRRFPMANYLNSLGVTEYRMENFQDAILVANKSRVALPKQIQLPNEYPIDLGVLAGSHFQLGNSKLARQFHKQMNENVKHEKYKSDAECLAFVKEVNSLFSE